MKTRGQIKQKLKAEKETKRRATPTLFGGTVGGAEDARKKDKAKRKDKAKAYPNTKLLKTMPMGLTARRDK